MSALRVAIVAAHIFMHEDILPKVIFSPGTLAIDLVNTLEQQGVDVTLYSAGPISAVKKNKYADLTLFEAELARRGDNYLDLLKKHPLTFVTLARQVQSNLIAEAYEAANKGTYDIVHVYHNEEELALAFSKLVTKPVVFTHHDPFNFLIRYKGNMPLYKDRNWLSISDAQRKNMPEDTNWLGTIYHGLSDSELYPVKNPANNYVAYLGRIISPKGVHLAIAAVKAYNKQSDEPLTLKICGKHYADDAKDSYWQTKILPELDDPYIEYIGFINNSAEKRIFLGNARALLVPSLFDEPFGMVSIEAFACGTPVIALDSGALPEVVESGKTGIIVTKAFKGSSNEVDEKTIIHALTDAIKASESISRQACRRAYKERFTLEHMASEHHKVYLALNQQNDR